MRSISEPIKYWLGGEKQGGETHSIHKISIKHNTAKMENQKSHRNNVSFFIIMKLNERFDYYIKHQLAHKITVWLQSPSTLKILMNAVANISRLTDTLHFIQGLST